MEISPVVSSENVDARIKELQADYDNTIKEIQHDKDRIQAEADKAKEEASRLREEHAREATYAKFYQEQYKRAEENIKLIEKDSELARARSTELQSSVIEFQRKYEQIREG